MRSRLRRQTPALVLAALAVCAVVVAVLAERTAWPLAPAFPWAHSGDFALVATRSQFDAAQAARVVAWCSAALAGVLVLASVVAALARRRRS
ncbi:hypothetical protein [Curtobacterium citri]|uniref:Uncharacterized protein n=1 Tax=Curtobacterium citri TaxID=3055139 RepID=A0ABT7TA69_9MICO|nr:hypothetical protein [Curtobacterium citri]MDM7886480.1 hypothetical protein [Curtobacterium citri]